MVGAYAKGGDAHLDEAVAKFPSLCEFLGQDLGESCSMASSVDALTTAIQNTARKPYPSLVLLARRIAAYEPENAGTTLRPVARGGRLCRTTRSATG